MADKTYETLDVTQVQVYPFRSDSEQVLKHHTLGLATVVLNDQILIRDLRIMDGANRLFVGYPYRNPKTTGEATDFMSVCNPITRALRNRIEDCVLEKYQAAVL